MGYLELFTRLVVKLAQNSEESGNSGLDNARQIVKDFGKIVAQMRGNNNDPFGEILVVAERREVTERLLFRQPVPILNAHHRDPVQLLHEVAALFADQNPSFAKIGSGQDLEGDLVDAIVDVLRDFDWGVGDDSKGQGAIAQANFLNVESLQSLVQKFDWIDLRELEHNALNSVENVSTISRKSIPFVQAVQNLLADRGHHVPGLLVEDLFALAEPSAGRYSWKRGIVFVGWRPPQRFLDLLRKLGNEPHVLFLSSGVEKTAADEPNERKAQEPDVAHSAPDAETEVRFALDKIAEYVTQDGFPEHFRSIAIAYTSESEYLPILTDELKLRGGESILWHGKTPDLLSATRPVRDFAALMDISTENPGELSRDHLLRLFKMPLRPVKELTEIEGVEYWHLRSFIGREKLYGKCLNWMSILETYAQPSSEVSDEDEGADEAEFATRRSNEAKALIKLMTVFKDAFAAALAATEESTDGLKTFPVQMVDHLMPAILKDSPYGGPLNRVASRAIADFALLSETWVNQELAGQKPETEPREPHKSRKEYAQARLGFFLEGKTVQHGKPHHGIAIGNIATLSLSEWDFIAVVGASDVAMRTSGQAHPLLPEQIIKGLDKGVAGIDISNRILTSDEQRSANAAAIRSIIGNSKTRSDSSEHRKVLVSFTRESSTDGKAWSGLYSGFKNPDDTNSASDIAIVSKSRWHLATESAAHLSERSHREREAVVALASPGVSEPMSIEALSSEFRSANAFRYPFGSEYFGNSLESKNVLEVSQLFAKVISATYVERFLDCPHHFFVTRVLGFRDDSSVDEVGEISSSTFGILVHRVFELFVNPTDLRGESQFGGDLGALRSLIPGCGEPYSPQALEHIEKLIDFVSKDLMARGLTGWGPSFSEKIANFKWLLPRYLEVDKDLRRLESTHTDCVGTHEHDEHWFTKPVIAEYSFGDTEESTVNIPVEHGDVRGSLRFKGQIDRVDVNGDLSHVSVVDYKTGQKIFFKKEIDKKIQYLLYAYAILQDKDFANAHSAFGSYLFFSSKDAQVGWLESPEQEALRQAGQLSGAQELLTAITQKLAPFTESFASGEFPPGHQKIKDKNYGYVCPSCLLIGQNVAIKANPHGPDPDADSEAGEGQSPSEAGEEPGND